MLKGMNACVDIQVLIMGPIDNNVYVVGDGGTTFIVDPEGHVDWILDVLGERKVDAIVLTHAHWDHVGGAAELREKTGARTIASAIDAPYISGEKQLDPSHRPFAPCPVDERVVDGDEVVIGSMRWKVLETPGHTPGSMCLFIEPKDGSNTQGAPVLIAGDTLFCGAHGRTDFVGGDPAAMVSSLARLHQLPDDTIVLPGHNDLTTIGRESWLPR